MAAENVGEGGRASTGLLKGGRCARVLVCSLVVALVFWFAGVLEGVFTVVDRLQRSTEVKCSMRMSKDSNANALCH